MCVCVTCVWPTHAQCVHDCVSPLWCMVTSCEWLACAWMCVWLACPACVWPVSDLCEPFVVHGHQLWVTGVCVNVCVTCVYCVCVTCEWPVCDLRVTCVRPVCVCVCVSDSVCVNVCVTCVWPACVCEWLVCACECVCDLRVTSPCPVCAWLCEPFVVHGHQLWVLSIFMSCIVLFMLFIFMLCISQAPLSFQLCGAWIAFIAQHVDQSCVAVGTFSLWRDELRASCASGGFCQGFALILLLCAVTIMWVISVCVKCVWVTSVCVKFVWVTSMCVWNACEQKVFEWQVCEWSACVCVKRVCACVCVCVYCVCVLNACEWNIVSDQPRICVWEYLCERSAWSGFESHLCLKFFNFPCGLINVQLHFVQDNRVSTLRPLHLLFMQRSHKVRLSKPRLRCLYFCAQVGLKSETVSVILSARLA